MSNQDTPDGQRGVVNPQQLLASELSGQASVTVTLPPNVETLWVFGEGVIDPLPTVIGVQTGYQYSTFWAPWITEPTLNWRSAVAIVANAADTSVTVAWPGGAPVDWWVVAVAGGPYTLDLTLAQVAQLLGAGTPPAALLVGGSDGTDLRALLVDSTGKLQVSGSTFPPVYGAPGSAAPADALQVGGSDGTDLRALLTDTAGHLLTIDQTLKLVVAALGAAIPADAALVAGSDGTDLRALLTDTAGRLLTIDQTLKLATAAAGAATPADAVQVGGSDGADLRAVLVDAAGHQLTIDQTLKLAIGAAGSATPADAVAIAGTDLTDLRVLQTDGVGVLQVADNVINGARGQPGGTKPSWAIQVGGNDGTDLRALLTDKQGVVFAIPSAPGEATGDRPPNELLVAGGGFAGSGVVIAAPGAGKRIRLYSAQISATSGTGTAFMQDSVATIPLLGQPAGGSGQLTVPLSGVALSTNAALDFVVASGSGGWLAAAYYTIETV